MKVLAYVFLAVVIFVPLLMGIWWLFWKLWLFVLPAVWADGPKNLIHPSYWLFVGIWVLLGLVASMFRGGKVD
jgi:hypothetical protein